MTKQYPNSDFNKESVYKLFEAGWFGGRHGCGAEQAGEILGISRQAVIRILHKYVSIDGKTSAEIIKERKVERDIKCEEEHLATVDRIANNKIPVELTCDTCGKVFYRSKHDMYLREKNSAYKTDKVFCSRECFYSYRGKTFGFGAHPKNIRHPRAGV